ncbi:Alpha/Beta hydrolase protein [Lipomyces tetrasporus]|uniref:Carboxylic ester hydrolase n=1 Tax=Lipomyces tetrasporus TaxID=54092 RepID=A0AAD7QM76_9ASCO|nr:Alpha/Beta hydrolase protein [Lipomyces tetrasporus]KAJ8097910.1 Alpha/Beta hydrolase protein [Lipomyces tetrasporus]
MAGYPRPTFTAWHHSPVSMAIKMDCAPVLAVLLALLCVSLGAPTQPEYNSSMSTYLPVIDLGYARYRAANYEKDGDYYLFSNIRYAAPPTGSRRFQLPEPPLYEEDVNDGSEGYLCNQATNIQFKWLDLLVSPGTQSEDCLFLDVAVPGWVIREQMGIFSSSLSNTTTALGNVSGTGGSDGLPVMTWIHGGGFTFGEKAGVYNPKGLMKTAQGKMVYVAFNYRLGAFGFLAGKEVKAKGAINAGFHDQRAALDWIRQHIAKFGGNPDDVTVMGESAGASSILHHLVATEDVQFHRAILQSTAFYPQYDKDVLESQYYKFASMAGCDGEDSFECLMAADGDDLAKVNKDAVYDTLYGTFQFGPYVDRTFIQLLPLFLLGYGRHNRGVEIMAAYNTDEGFIFTDPTVVSTKQFDALVVRHFPNATEEVIDELKDLYPESDYGSVFRRVSSIIAEWIVECNSRYLEAAYSGAYLYRVSVPPGIHSIDLPLTFWGGSQQLDSAGQSTLSVDDLADLAKSFQSYLVSFAVSGDPNKYRLTENNMPTIYFPKSDEWDGKPMVDVGKRGFSYLSLEDDGPVAKRCDYWQDGAWTGR